MTTNYIRKYYEFLCANCQNADYPPGDNIAQCLRYWRRSKGIFTKDKKVFCDKKCQQEYLIKNKSNV